MPTLSSSSRVQRSASRWSARATYAVSLGSVGAQRRCASIQVPMGMDASLAKSSEATRACRAFGGHLDCWQASERRCLRPRRRAGSFGVWNETALVARPPVRFHFFSHRVGLIVCHLAASHGGFQAQASKDLCEAFGAYFCTRDVQMNGFSCGFDGNHRQKLASIGG